MKSQRSMDAHSSLWLHHFLSILTHCQTNLSTHPFVAPKYGFVDFEGLLGGFAKYRLAANDFFRLHRGGLKGDDYILLLLVTLLCPSFYYLPIC